MKPLNFKVRGLCRKAPVFIARTLEFAGLFILAAFAGDLGTPLVISPTSNSALTITHCHPGDTAIIQIEPDQPSERTIGGTMFTTNSFLKMDDLSMIPTGTNYLKIQTVCAGITSAPVSVTLILKRTPPAPTVRHRRLNMTPPPEAPLPWGMKMALPNAGDPALSYLEYRKRIEAGTRRGQ